MSHPALKFLSGGFLAWQEQDVPHGERAQALKHPPPSTRSPNNREELLWTLEDCPYCRVTPDAFWCVTHTSNGSMLGRQQRVTTCCDFSVGVDAPNTDVTGSECSSEVAMNAVMTREACSCANSI